MSNGRTASRFAFHGNAMPIGGRVLSIKGDEINQPLNSPPGSSLSVAGGICQAPAAGSVFRDIFSWGQCVAVSQGEQRSDGTHVTTVTSSVQNVSAANGPKNVFKAAQFKLTLVSTHREQGQPSIVPSEVVFGGPDGMSLNGQKITVKTDIEDFRKWGTFDGFEYQFQNNKTFWEKYRTRFVTKEGKPPEFKQPIPRVQNGYVVCSIVSSIRWGAKTIPGHVLTQTGFGSIYFGEILINEYNRRMTLVRLSMGSDVRAEVAYAESDPNGSWIP